MPRRLNGRLNIKVVGATDLPDHDSFSGHSDPYCIVKLDDEEIGRTAVCPDEGCPTWNEKFFINLQGTGENVIFEIWDHDNARTDDLLASVTLSVDSITSAKEKKKKKEKTISHELVGPDGDPAGVFHYSMSFREFGGMIEHQSGGNRKSLHIGINYLCLPAGRGRLNGCHNDVQTLHDLITSKYGFTPENAKILRDDDDTCMPTRENIENAIAWLVEGAQSGDSLLFQFSGHGGQVPDDDGDEEDAKDETIIPCDYKSAGQITDDQLFRILVKPLPAGVMLTTIMDCCHSGTGMDLAFVHKIHNSGDEASRDLDDLVFDGFVEKALKKDKKGKKHKKKKKDDEEGSEEEDDDKKKKKKDDDEDEGSEDEGSEDDDKKKKKKKKKKKNDDDEDEESEEDNDEEKKDKKKKKKKNDDDEDEENSEGDDEEKKDKKKKKKKNDDDDDEGEDEDEDKKDKGNCERGKKGKKDKKKKKKAKKSKKKYDDTSDANVIMLSGCMDHQTSADAHIEGKHTGAMTHAFKSVLEESNHDCTYKELVASMYTFLGKSGYSQIPQLSTARPFDLNSKFAL